MLDERLKQYEKSLIDKIDYLLKFANKTEKEHLRKYGTISTTALTCDYEARGYQGALHLLYDAFPELKDKK